MRTSQAHRVVLISMLATFGFGFVHSFSSAEIAKHGKFPSPYHVRLFIGAGVVFIVLSAVTDFEPELGASFAALIGATATVTTGAPVVNQLLSLAGSEPKPTQRKK